MEKTYKINIKNMGEFEVLVEKLNKRAVKCGVNDITYEVKKEYFENKDGIVNKFNDVVVKYEDIKIDGYKVIATICHTYGNGNIVRLAPNVDDVDKKYYSIDGLCEHCHTNRRRKETVLLQDEDGNIIQVGKTCLKDFLGHNVNDKLRYLDKIDIFEHEVIGMDCYISGIRYISVEKILQLSNALIKKYGYIKTTDEYGYRNDDCTKDLVYRVYEETSDKTLTDDLKRIKEEVFSENYKDDEVQVMIDYLNNDLSQSNYIQNLRLLANEEYIDQKDLGYLVSLPAYYHRNNKPDQSGSEWVGEEKQRITIDVTLNKIRGYETMYGYMSVLEFIDGDGNILIWKTTKDVELHVGDKKTIVCTIKNHDEFRGVKQTNILRVVVKKEVV